MAEFRELLGSECGQKFQQVIGNNIDDMCKMADTFDGIYGPNMYSFACMLIVAHDNDACFKLMIDDSIYASSDKSSKLMSEWIDGGNATQLDATWKKLMVLFHAIHKNISTTADTLSDYKLKAYEHGKKAFGLDWGDKDRDGVTQDVLKQLSSNNLSLNRSVRTENILSSIQSDFSQWKLACSKMPEVDRDQTKVTRVSTIGPSGVIKIGDKDYISKSMDMKKGTHCHGTFVDFTNDTDCFKFVQSCVNLNGDLRECVGLMQKGDMGSLSTIASSLKDVSFGSLVSILKHFGFQKTEIRSSLKSYYQIESVKTWREHLSSRLSQIGQSAAEPIVKAALDDTDGKVMKLLSAYISVINTNYDVLYSASERDFLKKSKSRSVPLKSSHGLLFERKIGSVEVSEDLERLLSSLEFRKANRSNSTRSLNMGVPTMAVAPMATTPFARYGYGIQGGGAMGLPAHVIGASLSDYDMFKNVKADSVEGLEELHNSLVRSVAAAGSSDKYDTRIVAIKDSIKEIYDKFKKTYKDMLDLHKTMTGSNIFLNRSGRSSNDAIITEIRKRAKYIGVELDELEVGENVITDNITDLLRKLVVSLPVDKRTISKSIPL